MPPTYFPLRWESTGDQWWFASPIDYAAANGHYDLVRELLHIDTNLLIKLTSLPRIRRLETVWDDDEEKFSDVAKCRSQVAQKLLQECETTNKGQNSNSLIRAGYGGWLLYTAASAGDVVFVKELLERDPLLVFGEGEYGVTDMLYAAARSKSFERADEGGVFGFRSEMTNRAVHAAARGGNVEVLRDFLGDGVDVLGYRDARGSTVLHTAAGRGQVEVVKHLILSYDILNSVDNLGNTALHLAAYRGQLSVVEILTSASPSSASLTNNYGDTFLHMAVSGFSAPSFRRMDRQIELMKQLVSGNLINIEDIINVRNNDGRTALHLAVIDNIQSDIVELLMSVRYINLNIRDADGNTPLDLLKQRPLSASSEILIKRLISAGGISDCRDENARNAIASHLKMHHGIGGSPGTSFRIPDAEIFLYAGIEDLGPSSCDLTSTEYGYSGEITEHIGSTAESNSSKYKKFGSMNRHLKNLLRWPGKNNDASDSEDNYSIESYRMGLSSKNSPIPLRQQFSRLSSLPNNKRIMSLPGNLPSPSTKNKFAAGLTRGVLQVLPKSYFGSPSSAFSESSWSSSPVSADRRKGVNRSMNADDLKMKRKHGSFNLRLMNNYLCFGAQGLAVENSISSSRQSQKEQSLVV
ncbi:hypothetical protein DH2020_003749 [Rehmannia glutinosa]|uniref:Ankyrin repeat-containing protein n=1 Tax=Rehmannia glutinosa TaxID=99300 RepID=A0ABR0XMH5_REHGL